MGDAVGYCLVGPAYFFALSGFLELTSPAYGIAPTHPPSDLRLSQLLSALRNGADESFASIFEIHTKLKLDIGLTCPNLANCPDDDELFDELKTRYPDLEAAICTELIEFFKHVAPAIFEAAEKHVTALGNGLCYTPHEFSLDLQRHLDLLVSLVPPIEYTDSEGTHAASLADLH